MHCVKKIKDDIYYVGGSDRRIELFENVYPVPEGITYNSYLIVDDKTILIDTVDRSIGAQFMENVEAVLNDRKLDILIVQHMEPDHCSMIKELLIKYPSLEIVGNVQMKKMIENFFHLTVDNFKVIKENDVLESAHHKLRFVSAPMVHWPEVMVTYDETDKILFSADAFGTFGALSGNLFDDEVDFINKGLDEARRYYTNIVGKFGAQVNALLNKTAALDIEIIAPLHGPLHRSDLDQLLGAYKKWATYEPENQAVCIAYGSVYGNTENAVHVLASKLSERGIKDIQIYDVSKTHHSYIVAQSFRCSHIVFASITYNGGLFVNMEHLLHDLKAHNLQKRTVAFMENGSWGCVAGNCMKNIVSEMKEMKLLDQKVTIVSSLKASQEAEMDALADAICASMK